jgi:hypothetical protein
MSDNSDLAPTPSTVVFVGWALPTMLGRLMIAMVSIANPTLVKSDVRSQIMQVENYELESLKTPPLLTGNA